MTRPGGFTRVVVSAAALAAAQLLLVGVGAGTAHAQDATTAAAIEKIVALNKKAMDDIDTADFEPARKALNDAEKTAHRAHLDNHPVMARTYVHLGALYMLGYKDKQKAQLYFGKALDIQPDIRVDKNLNIAAVQDLFSIVQKQKGAEPGAVTPPTSEPPPEREPPPTPPPPRRPSRPAPTTGGGEAGDLPPPGSPPFYCKYPDPTPPKKSVRSRCFSAPTLKVAKVVLHYKAGKMPSYASITMAKDDTGWFAGKIPGKNVDGTSMQLYFEALNADDTPVVSNGRAESPNIAMIVAGGEGKVTKNCDEARAAGEACEENPFDKPPEYPIYGNRRFWIGLGVGSAAAIVFGGEPESRVHNYDDQTADVTVNGPGWAGLGQLVPEVGVQLNADWALSIEGRHQYIPQAKKVSSYTASGAHAVLLRLLRYSKQQRLRFYGGPVIGGGEGVRFNIYTDTVENPSLKDTVLIGPALLGGAVGIYYEITKKVSWVLETNALVGVPKLGLDFDFNTGIQVNFGDTALAAKQAELEREEKEKQDKLEKEQSEGGGEEEKPSKKAKSEDEAPAAPRSDDEVPKS